MISCRHAIVAKAERENVTVDNQHAATASEAALNATMRLSERLEGPERSEVMPAMFCPSLLETNTTSQGLVFSHRAID
jgi:hypothetical protein